MYQRYQKYQRCEGYLFEEAIADEPKMNLYWEMLGVRRDSSGRWRSTLFIPSTADRDSEKSVTRANLSLHQAKQEPQVPLGNRILLLLQLVYSGNRGRRRL